MNVITVIGRIVTDPTHGTADNGTTWCRLRLAVAKPRRAPGDMFITAVAFGRLATACTEHLATGRTIAVNGWLDNSPGGVSKPDGEHVIRAQTIDFLDPADPTEP